MSLLVTGSIGIDTVTTPHGTANDVLGGTAVNFAFAATLFSPVRLVGVVGEDFPDAFRTTLSKREIDLAGLETRKGSKTFRWTAKYEGAMAEAETLGVDLNVLAEHGPKVPADFADSEVVFLANTHPKLQQELLGQLAGTKLTVCDTMNLWIANERDELLRTLSMVDGVIINDGEARQLTQKHNLIDVAEVLLSYGPKFAVVKKGEHGALLMTADGPSVIPAYPTSRVVDPTGAGDSFAGGTLGYLSHSGDFSPANIKRAIVRGTVCASFVIEDFSINRMLEIKRKDVDDRVNKFCEMLRVD